MIDVLALDLATRTGFCRGRPGDQPEFGVVNFGAHNGATGSEVFASALGWVVEMIAVRKPELIILEALLPPTAKVGNTTSAVRDRLAGLNAIVRAVAKTRGVGEIAEASVGSVRAHFISDRSLPRDAAKSAVIERCRALGWPVQNADEADACALWSFACAVLKPELALTTVPLFNRNLVS